MSNNNRYCAIVNTHSTYHDVLSVFLKCYRRFVTGIDLFIFSNERFEESGSEGLNLIQYYADNFRDQYLECLKKIPHKYVLTFNDDYFITGTPNYSEILRCIEVLDEYNFSHIRFVRGPNFIPIQNFQNLYSMDNGRPYFFSQTLSIWRTSDLINVFDLVAPSGIGRKGLEPQFEVLANKACKQLSLAGLIYYKDEKKVGAAHYECNIVPHIVSSIVDGRWNMKEYAVDLKMIEKNFGVKLNPDRYPFSFNRFIKKLLS